MRPEHARPAIERLLARVEQITESGCWIFMGELRKGYSRVYVGSTVNGGKFRRVPGHRIAYEHYRGPIPAGLTIDHLCRVRCCVNPWHLEAVTSGVNTLRGGAQSAINAKKTECSKHKVEFVRKFYKRPGGRRWARICLTCRAEHGRRYDLRTRIGRSKKLWEPSEQAAERELVRA